MSDETMTIEALQARLACLLDALQAALDAGDSDRADEHQQAIFDTARELVERGAVVDDWLLKTLGVQDDQDLGQRAEDRRRDQVAERMKEDPSLELDPVEARYWIDSKGRAELQDLVSERDVKALDDPTPLPVDAQYSPVKIDAEYGPVQAELIRYMHEGVITQLEGIAWQAYYVQETVGLAGRRQPDFSQRKRQRDTKHAYGIFRRLRTDTNAILRRQGKKPLPRLTRQKFIEVADRAQAKIDAYNSQGRA